VAARRLPPLTSIEISSLPQPLGPNPQTCFESVAPRLRYEQRAYSRCLDTVQHFEINTEAMNLMDAIELLESDHKKVAGIMEKIDGTTERALKTREELFTQLKTELDLHAEIEEKIFYPVLEKAKESRDITLEAFEEHRLVKQLLNELAAGAKDDETWTAKFTVLKEQVEHHVEEEEGDMFKKARRVLSQEEIEELGARMEKAKSGQKAAAAR
jgi:hypothetical protein